MNLRSGRDNRLASDRRGRFRSGVGPGCAAMGRIARDRLCLDRVCRCLFDRAIKHGRADGASTMAISIKEWLAGVKGKPARFVSMILTQT